jgi:hypothetical protein
VATAQAQPNWDRYRPARLDTVVQNHRHLLDVTYDAALDSSLYAQVKPFPLRTRLAFGGKVRPVAPTTTTLMQAWAEARNVEAPLADLFTQEARFEGEERSYWMPVQKQLVPFLKNKWPEGGRLELYVQFIGFWMKEKDQATWVFMVNAYRELD